MSLPKNSAGKILVFADTRCSICKRAAKVLHTLDWLHRLQFVDFHHPEERKKFAPDIPAEDLHRAMHVRFPDRRIFVGFYAFRALAWHLPLTWILGLLLSIPGVPWMGEKIYDWVSRNRSHDSCEF